MRICISPLVLALLFPLVQAEENSWDNPTNADKLLIIEAKQWASQSTGTGDAADRAGWNVAANGFYPAFKATDIEVTGLIAHAMLRRLESGKMVEYETCRNLQRLKAKLEKMNVLDVGGTTSQEAYLALSRNALINRPVSKVFAEMRDRLVRDREMAKQNELLPLAIKRQEAQSAEMRTRLGEIDRAIARGDSTGDSRTETYWQSARTRLVAEKEILQKRIAEQTAHDEATKSAPLPKVPEWYAGTGAFVAADKSAYNVNAESLQKFAEARIAEYVEREKAAQAKP